MHIPAPAVVRIIGIAIVMIRGKAIVMIRGIAIVMIRGIAIVRGTVVGSSYSTDGVGTAYEYDLRYCI